MRYAALIDGEVETRIGALAPFAPLHQRRALAGIRAVRAVAPATPAVACFDNAFHASLPPAAATYALPRSWRGTLRAAALRLPRAVPLMGWDEPPRWWAGQPRLRIVSCHLGAGASVCAARGGRSVDTTMGFTPMEGRRRRRGRRRERGSAPVRTLVITARKEVQIAREVREVLGSP